MADKKPLSVSAFAAKIKAKYPEYKGMDDTELARKIVKKYPEYSAHVSFDEKKNSVGNAQPPVQNAQPPVQQQAQAPFQQASAPIQQGSGTGSLTSEFGSNLFQTPANTEAPFILNDKAKQDFKEQTNASRQEKAKMSQTLKGIKDVYYQAQGEASSFAMYDGYQSSIKRIDDELTKNFPDEATVSRTVSGQENLEKYKAKRDQLVADRNKFNELSKEVLLQINPKIEAKIDSDLKKNGLEIYTRTVGGGFKVPDEFQIDSYAKQIAQESGIADDGTFKKLVYDKVKSTISNEISAPKIKKEFEKEFVKETGMTPDQAVEKEFINNFLEGKKIQSNLVFQVGSLNKEIKTKVDEGVNTLSQQYKPMIESLTAEYKAQIAEAEAQINKLNESYKAGGMPRPQYEAAFTNIKSQFDLIGEQYKQQHEAVSKEFLNSQNEMLSKYNKRYKRQFSELQSMAKQSLSAASSKYGKEFTPSPELKKKFESIHSKATKNYLEKDEAIKYELDKSSLLNNLGGHFAKNFLMGIGGGLKSISSMYDFDAGYVFGDHLENSFVSSSPELKSGWDLLNPLKLQASTGRMLGGMTPIIGSSVLTAAVTKSAPTAIRLLTTGVTNYLIETAQIGGGVKDQVFQKTGNMADANKAAKKVMDANLYLLPLYALDGLPFLGNVTLGIKNTFARAGAKALIETATELPQEYFQGIFEDLAVADRPISQTFEEMSLERFENTALNVIPTSVLMGGGGTAIQGVRENISKFQGRSFAAKVNLEKLTETAKKQFVYDTVLRRGDIFSKAYVSSLYNSGNIDQQQLESFSAMIEESSKIMEEAKKTGLNKSQSKVYAALRFDYLQSKAEFDSQQDEVSKKLYKVKMDAANKSLNNYLSGKKPDAVVLTLANNEQYIYSFETLNAILNEGGEIVGQIVSGDIKIGLLSEATNPKAKLLAYKLNKLAQGPKSPSSGQTTVQPLQEEGMPAVAAQEELVSGDPAATGTPLVGTLDENVGSQVNYGGISGTLIQNEDGFFVEDADGNSVLIEGGLSGQTPAELNVSQAVAPAPEVAPVIAPEPVVAETAAEEDTIDVPATETTNITFDPQTSKVVAYGNEYTYEGVEEDAKGNVVALRVIDASGKVRFIRNEEVILEVEIQKSIFEEQNSGIYNNETEISNAAEEIGAVELSAPATESTGSTTEVQQEGSTENTQAPEVQEPAAPKVEVPKLETPLVVASEEVAPKPVSDPKEGDKVILPPRTEDGFPLTMIFDNGSWKERNVGSNDEVSSELATEAQNQFEQQGIRVISGYNFTDNSTLSEEDGLSLEVADEKEAKRVALEEIWEDPKTKKAFKYRVSNLGNGGWIVFRTSNDGYGAYAPSTGEVVFISHKKGGRIGIVLLDFVANNPRGEAKIPEQSPTQEAEVTDLEQKIKEVGKPNPTLDFITTQELVNSADALANKKAHAQIKENYKKLKQVLDCLWA